VSIRKLDSLAYLIITELLSQCSHQMPQLSRRDEPIAVFVEMPHTLDEVLSGVCAMAGTDSLKIKSQS